MPVARQVFCGGVSELADEHDLGSCAARRGGSSPPFPTRGDNGQNSYLLFFLPIWWHRQVIVDCSFFSINHNPFYKRAEESFAFSEVRIFQKAFQILSVRPYQISVDVWFTPQD